MYYYVLSKKTFTITNFYDFVCWSVFQKHHNFANRNVVNADICYYMESFNKKDIENLNNFIWKNFVSSIEGSIGSKNNFGYWKEHAIKTWQILSLQTKVKPIATWYKNGSDDDMFFGIVYRYRNLFVEQPYFFDEDKNLLQRFHDNNVEPNPTGCVLNKVNIFLSNGDSKIKVIIQKPTTRFIF